jgi:hypothetical protein
MGSGGAAPKLIEKYGNDPLHNEIISFYKSFIEEILEN